MPDYEKMYKQLFNEYTQLIELLGPLGNIIVNLKLAQQKAEEIAMAEDNATE